MDQAPRDDEGGVFNGIRRISLWHGVNSMLPVRAGLEGATSTRLAFVLTRIYG